MQFINELLESRATRNINNVKKYTRYDCVEQAYLLLLAIEMTRHTVDFVKITQRYARDSFSNTYNHYSTNQTDLHNYIYFISGPDSAQSNLADAEYAIAQKKSKPFPVDKLKKYLKSITNSQEPDFVTRFFMEVEKSGKITNNTYLDIRRTLGDWKKITPTARRTAATKLLYAFRAKLADSDFIIHLQNWSSMVDAELVSVPDTENKNEPTAYISNYKYLVGSDNILQTKIFLQLAKSGKSIPSDYVQAYMPIINMIDDLAQQGPGAMQHLLLLHKRLKK